MCRAPDPKVVGSDRGEEDVDEDHFVDQHGIVLNENFVDPNGAQGVGAGGDPEDLKGLEDYEDMSVDPPIIPPT